MKRRIPTLILLAGLVSGAAAQAGPAQGDSPARGKLRENIATLYLLRLTQALDLSEDQTAKLFPALTRIEREKAELQRRLAGGLQELRTLLEKSPGREPDLLDAVGRIREARRLLRQKDEEVEAVLEGTLTPVQKARYLIFTVDFYRGLGDTLNRIREPRPKLKRSP